jgi:cobaltochelatase CobS
MNAKKAWETRRARQQQKETVDPQGWVGFDEPNAAQDNQDAIEVLREMILGGADLSAGIDENQVRAIVQEQMAGIAPRVIEIRHDNKPPIKIEGLVHPEFDRALNYLSKKGPNGYQTNVMLVGPAGCGKSHMIAQLAKALGTDHTIVSGTAGATEGDLIGRLLPGDGGKFEYSPSQFVSLYERGNAVLGFDEIDGFDSNMLMIANMPLANGSMYVHLRKDNPEVHRGENVFFVATANTFGTGANPIYVGRNAMDEATRDRFIFITVDYDKRLEESIAAAGGLSEAEMAGIWELRDRCREAQLRRVISTRAFQKASVMKQCGDSWREIRDRLLEGWSKDEKAKVGV